MKEECDFCGEEFSHPPDDECSEHDYCVCDNCVDICLDQLERSGEIEPDED